MATNYTAELEFDGPADLAEDALEALAEYHPAAGSTDRGRLSVTLSMPAEDFVQAMRTTVAVTAQALRAPLLTASIMPTEEFDRRLDHLEPLPELVSVTEAAELLKVSRQAVLQRLERGTLPGRKAGDTWVIPRGALPR